MVTHEECLTTQCAWRFRRGKLPSDRLNAHSPVFFGQERYQKEQDKLKEEWEKAQKEVEEEERRYYEEVRSVQGE